jgi:aminoglycoside phosphotransferase (APT) family kinase protein
MSRLAWLDEWSVDAVRAVLDRTSLPLVDSPIALRGSIDPDHPQWSSGTARVGDRFVAKFALSEPTARRIRREVDVLGALSGHAELRLPEVVAASDDPVFFATTLVAGEPLSYGLVRAARRSEVEGIGEQLAGFLSALHQSDVLARVTEALGPVHAPEPPPQATTGALRARLAPMLDPEPRHLVHRWCDWVDDVLAHPGRDVFVHGDLHGHNQVWDRSRLRLELVTDFETSGAAEAEYDFRYLPAAGPGVELLVATMSHYRSSDRPLDVDHVMAWHVRTTLGEALWRSEAALPLLLARPGGGSPVDYVHELRDRFAALGGQPG